MKIDRDSVIFDSRREIEAIESALNQYLEDYPDEDNVDDAQQLCDLLEVMHRNW